MPRLLIVLLTGVIGAFAPAPARSETTGASDSVQVEVVRDDPGARRFLTACAGCHRLEGAKLNGPALSHVVAWPREQLHAAVKRMEKNVGPLSDTDLANLCAFLQAADAKSRLLVQEERVRAQFAKTLAPPDAAIGRRLFRGEQRLDHGGLACASCHRFAGAGGGLGPDLTDAATRLGRTPLASGIAGAGYKIMAPHYRAHPITGQEAAHLAEYLASSKLEMPQSNSAPLLALAGGGAALAFTGLAAYFGRRRRGPVRTGREG